MATNSNVMTKAESGDANAQFALAQTYWPEQEESPGNPSNKEEAKKWLRKAAEQGHLKAQLRLAALIAEEDVDETLGWLKLAAQQGSPEAAMDACYYLMEFKGDEEKAIGWYRQAILLGHPHRGEALGIYPPVYRDFVWGKRLVPPGEKIPRERRLARAGDPGAQYRLGALFANGAGVTLDFVQAFGWFSVAARPGQREPTSFTSKHPVITDWGTQARAVRILERVMEQSELEMAKSLATDLMNRFGGSVALGARLFYIAEKCLFLVVGIFVVLPVLVLRSILARVSSPKAES